MIAPEHLVRAILATNGAETAERLIREQGYEVSLSRLKRTRERMIKSGKAARMFGNGSKLGVLERFQATRVRDDSDRLLDAITALYQRTADKHGCSIEAAMKYLNFSRAQLERMAA